MKILTQGLCAAGLLLAAGAQAQPGPGGFQPTGPGFSIGPRMAPMSPATVQKTARINALRMLIAAHFTNQDLNASLGTLRELEAADRDLSAASDRLLDEELQSLLSAGQTPPPDTTPEKMRQAMEQHQQRQEKAWQSLAGIISPDKAGVLRAILGQGMPTPFPRGPGGLGGPGRGEFGGPVSTGTGSANGPSPFPGGPPPPGGPQQPGGPGGPTGPFPGGPGRPQGPMMGGFPGGFMGTPLSVPDLVDLIQQRLAAMKNG